VVRELTKTAVCLPAANPRAEQQFSFAGLSNNAQVQRNHIKSTRARR